MQKPAILLLSLSIAASALAAEPLHKNPTAEIWLDKCARCHGDTGAGDTKLGKKLNAANYRSRDVQKSFTDEELARRIREGFVVDGKPVMPSYKDELTEAETTSLVQYIRSLAK